MSMVGKIDHKTAFFSLTPGGLSEMANIGVSVGAEPEPIAISQALRVALLVCLMPPLIIALGIDGGMSNQAAQIRLSWFEVAAALSAGLAGVAVIRGQVWGRFIGIALVGLSLIANFMFLPHYPMWAIVTIALDAAIIWALAVHREGRAQL